jgi:cobalt-zinc-cadmium efflux system protein
VGSHNHHSKTTGNIRAAFFLNLCFTVIELIGGFVTNSMAILSDALHDLGDSLSLGLSWYLEKYASKKRDAQYTHGYARFSLLSALINAVVLITGSIFILIEAIPRIFNPQQPDTDGMMWLALLGILFNGMAVARLQGSNSMNQKMVSWHLLEDVLGWVGVLIIAVVMKFYQVPILDGLFSVLFTLFILFNVVKNLKKTLKIFLQGIPENMDVEKLLMDLQSIPNIVSSHDLRIWSMDGQQIVMTLHIVVPAQSSKPEIIQVKNLVVSTARQHGISHVTTEIEYEGEACDLVPV